MSTEPLPLTPPIPPGVQAAMKKAADEAIARSRGLMFGQSFMRAMYPAWYRWYEGGGFRGGSRESE